MLSRDDALFVARDSSLPGLATVLDPESFVDAIHAAIGSEQLEPGRITYVRYKPGSSCLVCHQLVRAGRVFTVSGTALKTDASDKLAKANKWAADGALIGMKPFVLGDRAVIMFAFPNDIELNALPLLTNDETRQRLIRKLLPAQEEFWQASIVPIRYKPERRFVARLDVNGEPRAVIKVYTRTGFPAAERCAKAFHSKPNLQCPVRLGRSNRHRVLALEWLPGRLLFDAMSDTNFDPSFVKPVGAALVELHRQKARHLQPRPLDEIFSALHGTADWLAHVCPHLARTSRKLTDRIVCRLQELPQGYTAVHGDFYAKQVLLGDGPPGIIDFDESYRGDSAQDLGSFLAHLECDILRGLAPANQTGAIKSALLHGYGKTEIGRVDLYAAVNLLRLSPHPFRNREDHWAETTGILLDRAAVLLQAAERELNRKAVAV